MDEGGSDAGRRGLLGRLADTYAQPLSRYFARRAATPADVPDMVQDVFLQLSRLPDPAAIQRPDSFVFVTAANVLRDRARRGRVRGDGLSDRLDDQELESSEFAPDRVLEGKQVVAQLRAALAELPERTRDVFVLRLLEGWKMAEVAGTLGISTRAAEKHQARALAHVAQRLEGWR